jgi:NADH pyrophosphatase NudC (nudix superfamily)
MEQYEWHAVGVEGIDQVKRELNKQAKLGWEFVQAYSATHSGLMGRGNNILIFRRAQPTARRCPRCGSSLDPSERFCSQCGAQQ